jgi:hypothetical protein
VLAAERVLRRAFEAVAVVGRLPLLDGLVAERLRVREVLPCVGVELVDLLRLAPKLSRCRYCGRIYVR